MHSLSKLIVVAALLSAGSAIAASKPRETSEAKLEKALAGRVAGKPVSCINQRDIRSSRIIDGTAILYETSGRKLYVNRPASGASSLRSDNILVTNTYSSQLCNVDIVRLFDNGIVWFPRGSIGLGDFVPYEKVKADKIG